MKEEDMVIIYATNISKLQDPKEVPHLLASLPQARQEKILRCRVADKRKQSLGAGLLLEYVLNLHGKSSMEIKIGENGKPQLENFFFNLSHAGDYVICAVGEELVGCDVEKITQEPKNLAEKYFCKSEKEHLNQLEGIERTKEFFRIWTLKESYMKMTGEGMRLALNRVEFIVGDRVKVYRDGVLCSCGIKEYEIVGYKCSVCSEDIAFSQELRWVDLLSE